MVHLDLPIGSDDPVATLHAVHAGTDQIDAAHADRPVGGSARWVRRRQRADCRDECAGTELPSYVCGRRMLEAYAYAPIAGHIRIGVAIQSYCDELYFGITGDWKGAADIERLAHGIDLAFEDLLKEAARRADRHPVGRIG